MKPDRLAHGNVVDQVGARGVQEDRVTWERAEDFSVDDAARAVVQCHVDGEDVGFGGELFERPRVADSKLGCACCAERATPTNDVQPERLRPDRDLTSDRSETRDSQGFPVDTFGASVFGAFPFSRAQRRERVRQTAVERDDLTKDELCDSRSIFARTVGDVDAFAAGSTYVDGSNLSAGANDQVEVARFFDGSSGDLGRADDQNTDVGDLRLERLFGEVRLVRDVDRKGSKLLNGTWMQLIGDQ